MASYYEANRERLANYHREYCLMHRRRLRFARYGLTIEDYEAMLAAQLGQCALCQRIPSYELVVDHDHKTGRVRGLLCHRCNAGLGYLGDTTAVLERALRYVDGELNNDDRGRGTYELRTMAAKRA